jgi:nucleobase:cation symporter-1, NCS1 family
MRSFVNPGTFHQFLNDYGPDFALPPTPKSANLRPHNNHHFFWGMYAGEHTAGTEFMIGPLFVAWGVGAGDLILGLLLGNLAAVLTWRYLTTPVS